MIGKIRIIFTLTLMKIKQLVLPCWWL